MPNVKTGKKKGVNVIFEIVKLEKDKIQIVFVSFIPKRKTKREVRGENVQNPKMEFFLERKS